MTWSWKIGTLFAIPVRVHVTMLIYPLIAFSWVEGSGPVQLLIAATLTVLLFGSIVAHELGHALTARRFGVHTIDIVLTPIGGMARIANMPGSPRHEIAIAIAGPLVSLTIAGAAFATSVTALFIPVVPEVALQALGILLWINLMLGLFNLIPALPMDGGRILRGYLATRTDFLTATRRAARIGRVIAVVGGVLAVLYLERPVTAVIIAVFVYVAAGSEERMALWREARRRAAEEGEEFRGEPPVAGGPRVHTWTWRSGGAPPDTSSGPAISGGKARIVSRRDPEEK